MAVTTINIDSQVLTFADLASFPVTGTVKTIYIAEDTNYQYYWDGSQYVLLTTEIDIPANLTFYATTAASGIAGYQKLVISIDDPDYDNPAVDVSTGAITGTGQLIAELASDAGIFAGNPGVITISTIGEIRRTAGSGGAEFYFEVYQRDSGGTETLVGTSNKTTTITTNVYQQFQVSALFNNGTWLTTDRVVIKYYADKVGGGSDPTYDFSFGGTNPVRTLFPISAQLLLNVPIAIGITGVTGGTNDFVLKVDSGLKLAQSELKTVGGNSLFGTGDIPVGGGITIGTSTIASGTVNRILFEGAGNVVQQDADFVWNNTDKRLILGTETAPDTNTRLVVIGKNTGATVGFAVHNSTGNNNALVVTDDTTIGIGAVPASGVRLDVRAQGALSTDIAFRVRNSANNNNLLTLQGDGFFGISSTPADNILSAVIGSDTLISQFTNTNKNAAVSVVRSIFSQSIIYLSTSNNGQWSHGGISRGSNQNIMRINATIGGAQTPSGSELRLQNHIVITQHDFRASLKFGNQSTMPATSNGQGVLQMLNAVAPTNNITDCFVMYGADIVGGNAAPHFRTENGDVVRLYRVGGWGLPTGSFTRTTFDTTTVTLEQLAERVAALIQDLRDNHQLLKA